MYSLLLEMNAGNVQRSAYSFAVSQPPPSIRQTTAYCCNTTYSQAFCCDDSRIHTAFHDPRCSYHYLESCSVANTSPSISCDACAPLAQFRSRFTLRRSMMSRRPVTVFGFLHSASSHVKGLELRHNGFEQHVSVESHEVLDTKAYISLSMVQAVFLTHAVPRRKKIVLLLAPCRRTD